MKQIDDYGFNGYTVELLWSYFDDQSQYIRWNETRYAAKELNNSCISWIGVGTFRSFVISKGFG